MKIVILAGGVGTRLSEETKVRPKPMVEVGHQPLLWHIMKHYSHYGFNEFVLCLGYKGEYIKRYFIQSLAGSRAITVDFARSSHTRTVSQRCTGRRPASWASVRWPDSSPTRTPDPRIPFRGAWMRLLPEHRDLVSTHIYKVPNPDLPFLGAHFTRGIDDRQQAHMNEASRTALLTALNIEPAQYATVADALMRDFAKLPRKEAIAVLCAIAASPDFAGRERVESFLVGIMQRSSDIFARRQAILGLAVLPQVRFNTVAAVVSHYETCQNLWETFPIQQFFEYHARQVRAESNYGLVRSRLEAVRSLYTGSVLGYLDS